MSTNLNRLIQNKKIKLYFQIESIADLNAVNGFMKVLGIKKECVVIRYVPEMTEKVTKTTLKSFSFIANSRKLSPNWFPIKFDTEGGHRFAKTGLIVNYNPYKYYLSVRVSSKERANLRRTMRLKNDRKVIVVSCSTRDEVEAVLSAYQGLKFSKKPLLILGMRKPDILLAGFLRQRGFRSLDRRSCKQALSRFGESDIVVLNTMGELYEFLKIAGLAIVGHDRNLFEPALLNVPILYFRGPVNISKKENELACLFKLFWRKNQTAKKLLDKFGGAAQIRRADFCQQIDHILRNPESMIRGTQKAVREFHRVVIPANRSRAAAALANGIACFKPLEGRAEHLSKRDFL